jgi:hypothetical protein
LIQGRSKNDIPEDTTSDLESVALSSTKKTADFSPPIDFARKAGWFADATDANENKSKSADVMTLMGQNFTGHLLKELSHTTIEESTVQEVSTWITERLTKSSRAVPVIAMWKVRFTRRSEGC